MCTEYIQKLIGISARFWLEAKNQAKWQIFHAYCGHAKVTKLSRLPLEKKTELNVSLAFCGSHAQNFISNSIKTVFYKYQVMHNRQRRSNKEINTVNYM